MFTRLTDKIVKALFFFGCALFLLTFVLILLNIGTRSVGSNLRGIVELSGYLAAASLGLCLPLIQREQSHASAGLYFARLTPFMQDVLKLLTCALCLFLSVVFTMEVADLTLFVHEGMETIDGLDVPSAFFVFLFTLACAGQGLVLLFELAGLLQKTLRGLRSVFVKVPTLQAGKVA